eukprot:4205421-Amphidinium_carterae.1
MQWRFALLDPNNPTSLWHGKPGPRRGSGATAMHPKVLTNSFGRNCHDALGCQLRFFVMARRRGLAALSQRARKKAMLTRAVSTAAPRSTDDGNCCTSHS